MNKRKPIPEIKVCKDCVKEKSISDFNVRIRIIILKDGTESKCVDISSYCKNCHSERNKVNKNKRRSETLKYHSDYNRQYLKDNREKINEKSRRWRAKNKIKNQIAL